MIQAVGTFTHDIPPYKYCESSYSIDRIEFQQLIYILELHLRVLDVFIYTL